MSHLLSNKFIHWVPNVVCDCRGCFAKRLAIPRCRKWHTTSKFRPSEDFFLKCRKVMSSHWTFTHPNAILNICLSIRHHSSLGPQCTVTPNGTKRKNVHNWYIYFLATVTVLYRLPVTGVCVKSDIGWLKYMKLTLLHPWFKADSLHHVKGSFHLSLEKVIQMLAILGWKTVIAPESHLSRILKWK